MDIHDLSCWDIPSCIIENYMKNGLEEIFQWQAECLKLPGVLDGKNLVYSAPTSAGKSLVAEILMIKRLLQTQKKAIYILPFVSVAREKLFAMKSLFEVSGLRIDGYIGGLSPPGGFSSLDIAICTIEKANGLINRLIEDHQIHQLCMIVVDEVHMVSDEHRGYLIELLLTKIRFMKEIEFISSLNETTLPDGIQIVGMSATVPNLELLSLWLDAALYETNFRPVPLQKYIKIGCELYDENFHKTRDLQPLLHLSGDEDGITELCYETLCGGHSVLVFCPTKNWCEKLARSIAFHFFQINGKYSEDNSSPHVELKLDRLRDIVEQLSRSPAGLDDVLNQTLPYGVAYHHAGLTTEERDIIEAGFRDTSIRVLVATSTLSSGVNLPARRVIIRSPTFNGDMLDIRTYNQMCGRAGRKGIDEKGESMLICKPHEKSKGKKLASADLPSVKSCLVACSRSHSHISAAMKRAILEVLACEEKIIVNGIASTYQDIQSYLKCTLLSAQLHHEQSDSQKTRRKSMRLSCYTDEEAMSECIKWLEDNEFVYLQRNKDQPDVLNLSSISASKLGRASLMSSLPTSESLRVLADLQTAAKAFALDTELHLVYQITPIHSFSGNLNWFNYLNLYENLGPTHRRVGDLVGVEERFLTRMAATGGIKFSSRVSAARERQINVHCRFYASLILHDLVQEVPLRRVCEKYDGNRGMIQSLQQSAATFAGMVTAFCQQLGWWSLEILLKEFQTRLIFGVQRELIDLMRISLLTNERARALYDAGFTSCHLVAQAEPIFIETVLRNVNKFKSKHGDENCTNYKPVDGNQIHRIYVPGSNILLTEEEAAAAIVDEAKNISSDENKNPDTPRINCPGQSVTKQNQSRLLTKGNDALNTADVPTVITDGIGREVEQKFEMMQNGEATLQSDASFNLTNGSMKSSQSLTANCDKNNEKPCKTSPKKNNSAVLTNSVPVYNTACNNTQTNEVLTPRGQNDLSNCNSKQAMLSQDVSLFCNQDTQLRNRLDKVDLNPAEDGNSITESQLAVMLDSDFSVVKSSGNVSANLPVSNVAENGQCCSRFSSDRLSVLPANLSSSTPIAELSRNRSGSRSFRDSSASINSQLFSAKSGLSSTSKRNCSSKSFGILKASESINDLFSSQHDFSGDLFSVKSSECSKKEISGLNSATTVPLINWSSESVFDCDGAKSDPSHSDDVIIGEPFKEYVDNITHRSSASDSSSLMENKQLSSLSASDFTKESYWSGFDDSKENVPVDLFNENISESQLNTVDASNRKHFNLVDIRCDKTATEMFFAEWSQQNTFAMSVSLHQNSSKRGGHKKKMGDRNEVLSGLRGISVYWPGDKVYYINFYDRCSFKNKSSQHRSLTRKLVDDVRQRLSGLKTDSKIVSFNVKRQLKSILEHFGIVVDAPVWQDPGIALWMMEPETIQDDVFSLVKKYCPQILPSLEELLRCNANNCKSALSLNSASGYVRSCVESVSAFALMEKFKENLLNVGMWKSFVTIEMPHLYSLTWMEINGVAIDINLLKKYKEDLQKTCQMLQDEAWKIVGRKFNLSSPMEISRIVYGEMGFRPPENSSKKLTLHDLKRQTRKSCRKKVWSTSKEALESLCQTSGSHPLLKVIMDWRSASHALSMVLHPIYSSWCESASSDGFLWRHHPLTIARTSTGRVSMADPNLQNIPKTTTDLQVDEFVDDKKKQSICLRDIITACKGFTLLSADYSQLELRIMTHLSQDQSLLQIFAEGGDVFRKIAAELSGKTEDVKAVTEDERTNAKRMCYGILYGMGAEALAKQMNSTEDEAQAFIGNFMRRYPKLQACLRNIVLECREVGYIVTTSGRRRHLSDINSANVRQRTHAERQAVNSTIQGSAADLVKAATCAIDVEMRRRGWSVILQQKPVSELDHSNNCFFVHHIHDEIMYEVETHLVKKFAAIVRECMLHALPLNVRLDVKIKTGRSWGQLIEYTA